ncbi:HNH endonuclease signature motif containing protein [Actinomycetospora sp. NBRC 106375]|uniref:HNH endonuclease signature motif containing protein n=1 Tax=Actinomycetospora sp. NBRC 106375 TaxID=3032207 RepID=UPI0025529D69|nr:HNH endonuclease signature motif containing protein [Actinomycetospora sp. NBRC 106375]
MSIDQGVRVGREAEPDATLVAALEGVSPGALTGEALGSYVRDCWRVHNRATATLFDALHHLGRAEADTCVRRPELDEFSRDEASALLGWSSTMAARRLNLADDLLVRLPEVGEALHAGWLDETKARTVSEWTADLSEDHAHEVCQVVLPEAPGLPVRALQERIESVIGAVDPGWAERRRKRAESRAQVLLSANPSGTATLSFVDAPAPDGIASQARIDALAAAVRALGVLTPIKQLRLQVGMRLLDGSTAGVDDRSIAIQMAAEYHAATNPDDPDGGTHDAGPDDPTGDDPDDGGPDDSGPDDSGPDDSGPDDDHGPDDDDRGEAPDLGDEPEGGSSASGGPVDPDSDPVDTPTPAPDVTERGGSEAGEGGAARRVIPSPRPAAEQGVLDLLGLPPRPGAPEPELLDPHGPPDRTPGRLRQGSVELRIRLSTALGLDQHPATVPGYGTVLPHDALAMLHAHRHGEWRVVLTDHDGRLAHVLLTRRRPPPPSTRHPRPRGEHRTRGRQRSQRAASIVELQVPTTLLAALDPDRHPGWAPLIRELQTRARDLAATSGPGRPPDADDDLDQWSRRRPGAELDRWIRVRDRCCVVPGCRRPAHRAEIDHTRDHAYGGPTASWNLGAWCTHHHRAKHRAGWCVSQPAAGRFVIRTRAGVTHVTAPKRVIDPLPDPRPAARPRPLPPDGWPEDVTDDEDDHLRGLRAERRRTTPPPLSPTPSRYDGPPPF